MLPYTGAHASGRGFAWPRAKARCTQTALPNRAMLTMPAQKETTKDRTAVREEVLRIWGQKAHNRSSPSLASPTRLVKLTGGPGPRCISQFPPAGGFVFEDKRAFLAWSARPASASRIERTNTKRKKVCRSGRAFERSLPDLSPLLCPRLCLRRRASSKPTNPSQGRLDGTINLM
jgi:hypothetical protein